MQDGPSQENIDDLAIVLRGSVPTLCDSCARATARKMLVAAAEHMPPPAWSPTHIALFGTDRVRVVRKIIASPTLTIIVFENEDGRFGDMNENEFRHQFGPLHGDATPLAG
jgi:hypothetical protein